MQLRLVECTQDEIIEIKQQSTELESALEKAFNRWEELEQKHGLYAEQKSRPS